MCFLFADDTTVFYSSSEDLKRLTDMFKANKLSLNINKTNYMILFNTQNAIPQHTLRIENEIFNRVTHTKFLGIITDNRLS